MEAADRQLPRDPFDAKERSPRACPGRDPDSLFEWVQTNTILLPYRGRAREAASVLMDRGGANLDRASLAGKPASIHRMGSAAGEYRSKDQAEDLLDQTLKVRCHAEVEVSDDLKADRQRVTKVVTQLLKVIGDPPPEDAVSKSIMIDALADHWWVQRRDGSKWIDLELSAIPSKRLHENDPICCKRRETSRLMPELPRSAGPRHDRNMESGKLNAITGAYADPSGPRRCWAARSPSRIAGTGSRPVGRSRPMPRRSRALRNRCSSRKRLRRCC